MVFPIPKLISHVSGIMKLEEGDVILTGTPKGVGAVKAGQVLEAGMGIGDSKDGLCRIRFPVVKRGGSGQFAW
jgi:acylpyruvate hydrolase